MLTDIMIGQYFPGRSLLHRLDPRVKLVELILLLTAVFVVSGPAAYGALSAMTVILMLVSGVPVKMYMRSIKPLWWIIAFTVLIHMFMTDGQTLWQWGALKITREGVNQAVYISVRLILLILLSSLLTFTTSPITLTDALERLMKPLTPLGIPAHELAMMMTIALRFIPTLLEETERIMKAQEARGADFASGNILRRIKNMVPILVPLFISAFRRADELAVAMEARCYRGGGNRTRLKVLTVTALDYGTMAFITLFLAGLGALKFYGW